MELSRQPKSVSPTQGQHLTMGVYYTSTHAATLQAISNQDIYEPSMLTTITSQMKIPQAKLLALLNSAAQDAIGGSSRLDRII